MKALNTDGLFSLQLILLKFKVNKSAFFYFYVNTNYTMRD